MGSGAEPREPSRAKTALRRLAVLALALALVAGLLRLFVPAAELESDGPPDPILRLRRPVVGMLRWAGVLDEPLPDPWLPNEETGGGLWFGAEKATWDGLVGVRREPVYRGLLWHVGVRVTVEQEVAARVSAVRVTWRESERDDFGPPGVRVRDADTPGFVLWRAQAFVPDAAPSWSVHAFADGRWIWIPHSSASVTRRRPEDRVWDRAAR